MKNIVGLGVILTIIFALTCACEIFVAKEDKNNVTMSLSDYLLLHYDKGVRPNCGSRTDVKLDMYIVSFGKIEEALMEFSVFLYYRQKWHDHRLAGLVNSSVVLTRDQIENVWFPDTYCGNAKTSNLMLPANQVHSMLKLSPDGSIFYSRNAHIIAACDMNLHEFPMDSQFCSLTFASYGYNDNDIKLSWESNNVIIENKEIAQFSIKGVTLSSTTNAYSTGNYTILKATFSMDRRIGYYVIQTYVPCTFLVMLSWIVFWMSTEETGNRLTVGITTILTIMFLLGYTNGGLPKVSYIKGMDMYLMVSFLSIFLSIVECIIVDKCYKREQRIEAAKKKGEKLESESPRSQRKPMEMLFSNSTNLGRAKHSNPSNEENGKLFELVNAVGSPEHLPSCTNQDPRGWIEPSKDLKVSCSNSSSRRRCNRSLCECPALSIQIDMAARVLFPCLWIAYNLVYWQKYML